MRICEDFPSHTTSSPPDDDDDDERDGELQIIIEFPNMPWRFPLMCNPADTIATVRKGIVSEHAVHDQLVGQTYIRKGLFVLVSGTRQLKDESVTLEEGGIKHMDALQVFEDAWLPIVISTAPGHIEPLSIRVDMKCFDTVGTLKGKLRDATGVQQRRLVYKGWYLDDEERRLVDYGIAKPVEYDQSVASKGYENSPFWDVDRPTNGNGEFLVILASSDDPIRTLQITFEIPWPNTPCRFPLTFKPSDTIGAVREGVIGECRQRGGPFDRSYIQEGALVLVCGAKQLRNESTTLDQCGIRHMDSVQMFEKASFGIDIYAPGLHAIIEVSCFETVGKLKKRLQVLTGIPRKKLHLKYSELYVEWYLDDDKRRLADFGISEQVEWDGELLPVDARIHVASSKEGLLLPVCFICVRTRT